MQHKALVGVLILNTNFPRLPGDIGNPVTFRYPVKYITVQSATPANITVATELPESLQSDFCDAARQLIDLEVSVITTSCGFLTPMQEQLSKLSTVPVICSALSLMPLLATVHGGSEYLGVLTFNRDTLNQNHIRDVIPGAIEGLRADDSLRSVISRDLPDIDREQAQTEVLTAATRLLNQKPAIRAIVLECTNLSPYKNAIRQSTGLPVYDVVDAVHWLIESQPHQPDSQP